MLDQSKLQAILKLSLNDSALLNQSAGTTERQTAKIKVKQITCCCFLMSYSEMIKIYSPLLCSDLSASQFVWGFWLEVKLGLTFSAGLVQELTLGTVWIFGLAMGQGCGDRGGSVGVCNGVKSPVNPSKLWASAKREAIIITRNRKVTNKINILTFVLTMGGDSLPHWAAERLKWVVEVRQVKIGKGETKWRFSRGQRSKRSRSSRRSCGDRRR